MDMDYNIVRTHFKNVRGVEGPAGGYRCRLQRLFSRKMIITEYVIRSLSTLQCK